MIGNYHVEKALGTTGNTMLYRARHEYIGKEVLLEATSGTGGQAFMPRFKFVARLLGRLKHPKILPLYDAFEDRGTAIMVFELPQEIVSVEKLLKQRQRLELPLALSYAIDCCDVLDYLHQQGIVHRDISPLSMLVAQGRFYLAGFDSANTRQDEFPESSRKVGWMHYMAPEAIRQEAPDVAQDIWGLGVSLYQMLSGQLPFPTPEIEEDKLQKSILQADFRPLSQLIPELPPEIDALLARMLTPLPQQRPSLATIKQTLENVLYSKPIAHAFVAMPFQDKFAAVYQAIKDACRCHRMMPHRVDENIMPANIWSEIQDSIASADLLIADLSASGSDPQPNANVALEVGIARALNKQTLLLTQNIEHLPFDLKQERAYAYQPTPEGLAALQQHLTTVIANILSTREQR